MAPWLTVALLHVGKPNLQPNLQPLEFWQEDHEGIITALQKGLRPSWESEQTPARPNRVTDGGSHKKNPKT